MNKWVVLILAKLEDLYTGVFFRGALLCKFCMLCSLLVIIDMHVILVCLCNNIMTAQIWMIEEIYVDFV